MSVASFRHWLLARLILSACFLCASSLTAGAFQLGAVTPGGGFVVFGRVSLPNGQPAKRVKVFVEAPNGLKRDTITNEEGNYEIRGLIPTRYRVYAINPDAPEQYSDRAESDSTRAYSNRLQIDVYLRLPIQNKADPKPGTVNATEAAIPKAARKAYDQGVKHQKESQDEKALLQFNQAIDLYPEYFQALTERGNLLMQHGKLVEAQKDFERALQLNNRYSPALRGLGYCQIQQKNFAAALSNLENSYVLEPGVPLTLLLLGYANLSLNHYEEAKQSLQQALKIGPDTAARAYVYLAEIYAHEENFKEAAESVHKYLALKPNAPDATQLKAMETQWRERGKAAKKSP